MTESSVVKRVRVESIDIVRGVVMILMALDHTREYLGIISVNPTDLAQTSGPLFFTRWITHFCAPVFFLLTGTGAYLSLRTKTRRELSRFLFTRGVWLIVLEVTIMRCLGFQFNFDYRMTMLFVFWALGWSMIVLSALVHLSAPVIATFGIAMIALHNLFDSVQASSFGAFAPLWSVLHSPGFVVSSPEHLVFSAYPLVPWVGVTAAGFGLGQFFDWSPDRRRPALLRLGLGLTAAFVVLRAVNVYGDPVRWTTQESALLTVLSFINTTKYPPSLLFVLMTLGPAMLLLGGLEGRAPRWLRPALVVGKVPMFYFIIHVPLIHLLAVITCWMRYGDAHWMFESPGLAQYPFSQPPGWGFHLPVVYLFWAFVVLLLYPLCRWFSAVKEWRREAWLSYL